MIRHLVHLCFQDDVTDQEKQEIYDDLRNLSGHINGILDFQAHENVSVETPLVRGFLDMFWFDFRDAGVRAVYLQDAGHQAIGARIVRRLKGGADGVFVCDIEV